MDKLKNNVWVGMDELQNAVQVGMDELQNTVQVGMDELQYVLRWQSGGRNWPEHGQVWLYISMFTFPMVLPLISLQIVNKW